MISKFTDLEAWMEAHKLTLMVYRVTAKFPKEELYGLVMQMRRAVVSIESCIAEGFNRFHYKDRLNFYFDSRGSLGEVQTQALVGKDLGFMTKEDFDMISAQADKVGVILGGLIRSTQNLSKK